MVSCPACHPSSIATTSNQWTTLTLKIHLKRNIGSEPQSMLYLLSMKLAPRPAARHCLIRLHLFSTPSAPTMRPGPLYPQLPRPPPATLNRPSAIASLNGYSKPSPPHQRPNQSAKNAGRQHQCRCIASLPQKTPDQLTRSRVPCPPRIGQEGRWMWRRCLRLRCQVLLV